MSAIQEIQDDLDVGKVLVQGYSGVPPAGMQLWNPKLATASEDRISRSARAGLDWYSHSAYIYTSGTTGTSYAHFCFAEDQSLDCSVFDFVF